MGTDFFGEGGEFFGAAGDEDGGDAALGELEGDGFADALGGAGDDGVGWVGIVRSCGCGGGWAHGFLGLV